MAYLLVNASAGALSFALNVAPPGARAGLRHGRDFHVRIPRGEKIDLCKLLNINEEDSATLCAKSPQFKQFKDRLVVIDTTKPPEVAPQPAPVGEYPGEPGTQVVKQGIVIKDDDQVVGKVTAWLPNASSYPPADPSTAVVTDSSGDVVTQDMRPPKMEDDFENVPSANQNEPLPPPTLDQVAGLPEEEPNDSWSKEHLCTWALSQGIDVSRFESKKKIWDKVAKFLKKE